MKVKNFIRKIEELKAKTSYDIEDWEMCVLVRTLDDKYVGAYSIEYDGTDCEGNFYFEPEKRVYCK